MLARVWVRLLLGLGLVALLAYSLFVAPPRDVALERAMWAFQFDGVDASLIALFLTMGLNSDLFVVLLLRDSRFRRVPGWPIALTTFVLGSFIMLPYLALRGAQSTSRPVGHVTRIASSRGVGLLIASGYLAVIVFAFERGDARVFANAARTTWFINVMLVDFAIECVLLWLLVAEARRIDPPKHEPALARLLLAVPIVGPALWNALVIRD